MADQNVLEEIRDLLTQLLAESRASAKRQEEVRSMYQTALHRQLAVGSVLVAAVVLLVVWLFWRYV